MASATFAATPSSGLLGEPRRVDLRQRLLLLDHLRLQRLRVRRLVALVVAPLAVADHVDDHVALELLAELERQLRDRDARLRVLGVDVEDRRLDELGDVGAVLRAIAASRGLVVKPIWLLTTTWIVPPVL